jgi:uncharacterized protein (TIGR03492 family)
MKLLVVSNGHGEDIIAIQIIAALKKIAEGIEIAALPIVGRGNAYIKSQIPIAGKVKQMPSGGFIYQDGRQLWRDMQGGLLQLTFEQDRIVRTWGKAGGCILAVGDIVPLLFAWRSGANYAFVGTAKSEYYLRDEGGWLSKTSAIERWLGSVYLPWDRFLMENYRCRAVFPRDPLTTQILQQWSIPAFDLGNPMMDGIVAEDSSWLKSNDEGAGHKPKLSVLLLPGSRMPEAEGNWQKILEAIESVIANYGEVDLLFLGAIDPGCSLDPFQKQLIAKNWNLQVLESIATPIKDSQAVAFTNKNATLILTQNTYANCLVASDLAIAMAGTATEQFVGLGKPVFSFPGEGPQFTYAFAEAQTRLLGVSVIMVDRPDLVGSAIASVLNDCDRMRQIAENGKKRMGTPGAASRIAECLMEKLLILAK